MIDAYSLCPGGTGKKIKFCCRNRLEDFRKIQKYMEASQFTACLNYVDALLKTDSQCACFLATRCVLLKAIADRDADFIETAKRFYECHPENPIAIAESAQAMLLEEEKVFSDEFGKGTPSQPILQLLKREQLHDVVHEAVLRYEKAFYVPQPLQYDQVILNLIHDLHLLIEAGYYESANAWLGISPEMNLKPEIQERFIKNLSELKTSKKIPLYFRIGLKVRFAPENAPWKEAFDLIIKEAALKIHWKQAVYDLKMLASQNQELLKEATFWYDLALINEWLCDLKAAKKFWMEYLNCPEVSFYDALLIRIRMSSFNDSPFDDEMTVYELVYPLTDPQAVLEKLRTESVCVEIKRSQKKISTDSSMISAFDLLDSPVLNSTDELKADEIPVVIANMAIWSATDEKPGYLGLANILEGAIPFVRETIENLIKPWQTGEVTQNSTYSISVTLDFLWRKIALPPEISDEKIREIKNAYIRSILLNRWIHYPLGILKNQSMKKAAQKPELKSEVETVLYVLRYWLEREKLDVSILKELRETLELAPLPKITTEMVSSISPVFYDQLTPECLSPQILEQIFFISRAFNANNIPREILESIVDDSNYSVILRVEVLKNLWSLNPQMSRTLEIVKKGRTLCEENNIPDVFFDIMEVAYSINEGKFHTVFEKIKHIRKDHSDDDEALRYISQLSQYMYGVIQNMNTTDLSALEQKSPYGLPSIELLKMNNLGDVLNAFCVLPDEH